MALNVFKVKKENCLSEICYYIYFLKCVMKIYGLTQICVKTNYRQAKILKGNQLGVTIKEVTRL